jgi:hypothetical protein
LDATTRLAAVQTMTFQKLAQTWPAPTHLTLFKLEPLRGIGTLGRQRLDAEKSGASRTAFEFFFGGFAHAFHPHAQANRNTRQGVVAVQHHMLGVNIGHGEQRIFGRGRVAACGQGAAFQRQAHLQFGGEQRAGLQKQELVVEVAKGFLGFDLDLQFVADTVALQCCFDGGQQVFAAEQKLHRLVQNVQFFPQSVLKDPGQSDHAVVIDFHRTIVAVSFPLIFLVGTLCI